MFSQYKGFASVTGFPSFMRQSNVLTLVSSVPLVVTTSMRNVRIMQKMNAGNN